MNSNITKVYLLDVPLENDYKHTLYFTSKEEQSSFFLSKKKKEYTNFTYQRKDNLIYVPDHYDDIYNCNYVMYQNSKYSNKWFYAFIKNMKYENDECTIIEIETDCIQTWLFDYTVKPSFVEREHVNDDTIGKHTVPENLETGDYICVSQGHDGTSDELCIIVAYSDYANSKYDVKGDFYNGIYSGVAYSVFPYTNAGRDSLNTMLSEYDDDAKAEGIVAIFIAPKWIALGSSVEDFGAGTLGPSQEPREVSYTSPKITAIDGHTVRNKKLLTYPYFYLNVNNGNGSSAIFKPELFAGNDMKFKIKGCVTPGCSIRLIPVDYNGVQYNQQYGLNGGKFPICCWNTDVYTNWLTENSVNNSIGVAGGLLSVAGGIGLVATGGGALAGGGLIAGGIGAIANTLGQVYQHSLIPDQVKGNVNCGDVVTSMKQNKFLFYLMCIKKEYADIIDSYFDMFGYKVNVVKVPNKAHRSRYWYTKTIDVNIDGSIPNDDMQKIKNAYNNGITFWRNANEIQNYDLSNNIV